MRFFHFALASLLLFSSASAQNNTSEGSPPPFPDVQGTLAVRAVFSSGSPVSSMPIVLLARTENSQSIIRTITGKDGTFLLSLHDGNYELDALLDLPNTSGIDYASTSEVSLPSDEQATLIFYPAGSLSGVVAENGYPLSGATVGVSCPSSAFDYARINGGAQVQAGEAGNFLFRALPVGTCMVSASTGSLAGSTQAEVGHGASASSGISVLRKSAQFNDLGILVAAVAALAIAAALFYKGAMGGMAGRTDYGSLQQEQNNESGSLSAGHESARAPAFPGEADEKAANGGAEKKEDLGESEGKAHVLPSASSASHPEGLAALGLSETRVSAVLATLPERQREVARFLIESGGRAKRSQIQHRLLIPKTSLLRNLRSLERKNIVKLTPFGRNLLAEINEGIFRGE